MIPNDRKKLKDIRDRYNKEVWEISQKLNKNMREIRVYAKRIKTKGYNV